MEKGSLQAPHKMGTHNDRATMALRGGGCAPSTPVPPAPSKPSKPCPNGCGYMVTWHATHCCEACKTHRQHGPRCQKKPAPAKAAPAKAAPVAASPAKAASAEPAVTPEEQALHKQAAVSDLDERRRLAKVYEEPESIWAAMRDNQATSSDLPARTSEPCVQSRHSRVLVRVFVALGTS